MLEEVKARVLDAGQELRHYNLITMTGGNVSEYIPEKNVIVITPSSLDYLKLKPEDMLVVDMDGNVVEGTLKPSNDTPDHLAIYKAKPLIRAVIHTHSIYATAFSCVNREIPCLGGTFAMQVGGSVPVAQKPSYLTGFREAEAIINTVGDKNCVLTSNHGVNALGFSLYHALCVAVYTEEAAHTYAVAEQLGKPHVMTEEEIKFVREKFLKRMGIIK